MQRTLSGFEKAFCLSEPPVPINHAIVARFVGEPDEASLRIGLNYLRERYPMAAMRLQNDEDGKPCYTSDGVPDFPLRVTAQAHEESWQQVAAQELGTNFDLLKGPMIRAVLLKRRANLSPSASTPCADLVLTFHHGIADGMSAVYFLRDLLCLLKDSSVNLPVIPPPPDLLSLIPETAKRSLSLKAQILGMKSGLWLMQHFPPFRLLFPPADRLIEGRLPWQHMALVSRCLTKTQTTRLADLCREKGTSIHAAISAAWLRARLEIKPNIRNWKRIISSPVNLRGLLDAENVFGMFMSNAVIAVDCPPSQDFWTIARQIKARLNHNIQTGRVYQWALTMLGLMDSSLTAISRAVPTFATQPVNYDFSISNLGRLSLPAQNSTLKLESVYGPIVNTSEREMTVGISTACDHLTMTLTYRDFLLNPEDAEKMADKAVDILAQVVGW
ncbi:MAG: hypothetical protein JW726_15695 [Anaerolineales bacterium]|nr:hypothetical protein [Anaerolineales bacterium]